MECQKTITIIVLNEHGVLSRISGLFAGRGYNIESLNVAPMLDNKFSKITLTTKGDNKVLEQILKQLNKLIPVLKVYESDFCGLEAILIKFDIKESLNELSAIFGSYGGNLLEVNEKFAVFIAYDTHTRINNLLQAVKSFSPRDITRSGILSIEVN